MGAAAEAMHKTAFTHLKVLPVEDYGIDETARTFWGYASTRAVDRDNEIIHPEAFSEAVLSRYMRNPMITWMHDWTQPIGVALETRADSRGLFFRARISQATERARETWGLIEDRVLRTVSVGFSGFYGKDYGYVDDAKRWNWTAMADLYEIAVATIPSNHEATFWLGKSLGLEMGRPEQYDTDEEREEARALADIERARTACVSLANITRHWTKDGGAPSARIVTACATAASSIAASVDAVTKDGQVLSGANFADLQEARSRIDTVIRRHEDSRAGKSEAGGPARSDEDPQADGAGAEPVPELVRQPTPEPASEPEGPPAEDLPAEPVPDGDTPPASRVIRVIREGTETDGRR